MIKSRLCLKDKSSVLVEEDIKTIHHKLNTEDFILVTNSTSGRQEIHQSSNIWCVRQHREEKDNVN